MVNSDDSDSCTMSTHSATGSTTESTDSLLKFNIGVGGWGLEVLRHPQ